MNISHWDRPFLFPLVATNESNQPEDMEKRWYAEQKKKKNK